MLLYSLRDHRFLCVCVYMSAWVGGWIAGGGRGGGGSAREPTEMFSTAVSAAPAQDETEYGSGVTDWRRRKSRASCEACFLTRVLTAKRCFEAALVAPQLFQPARLRTELDLQFQEIAAKQSYCMSKHGSDGAPVTQHKQYKKLQRATHIYTLMNHTSLNETDQLSNFS